MTKTTSASALRNRAYKDRKRRAKLRARLRAEGVAEALIDRIVEQQAWDDLVARVGLDRAQAARKRQTSKEPDDTGYQPSAGDPLLRGAARVGGVAAKVARRQTTITKFQYDRAAATTEAE